MNKKLSKTFAVALLSTAAAIMSGCATTSPYSNTQAPQRDTYNGQSNVYVDQEGIRRFNHSGQATPVHYDACRQFQQAMRDNNRNHRYANPAAGAVVGGIAGSRNGGDTGKILRGVVIGAGTVWAVREGAAAANKSSTQTAEADCNQQRAFEREGGRVNRSYRLQQ